MSSFIDGIYNYCDRWCSRCTKQAQCRLFEEESKLSNDGISSSESMSLEKLSETFQQTLDLLNDYLSKNGMPPSSLEALEQEERYIAKEEEATRHPLSVSAESYARKSRAWLRRIYSSSNNLEEIHRDVLDVLSWYTPQIPVKIKRALMSIDDAAENETANDADGSAKIALIGIRRSIAAYGVLIADFEEENRTLFALVMELEELIKSVQRNFPEAQHFIRPGFDTEK